MNEELTLEKLADLAVHYPEYLIEDVYKRQGVYCGAGALFGIGGSVTSIRKFMDV